MGKCRQIPVTSLQSVRSFLGFALSLIVPSTAVVQRYLGIGGVILYVFIVFSVLWFGYRYLFAKFLSKITNRQIIVLAVATFLLLVFLFSILYPLANSGILGRGSDRDEALNIATRELLKGHYPYYPRTYLGNPISPLPGSLILAIPFVLIGNSAYQNLFWLFAFLFGTHSIFGDRRIVLLLLWIIIVLSPSVLHEIATGGDLLANSIYVFLFLTWMVNVASQPSFHDWKRGFFAILLGIGIASRANFVFILPLLFSYLSRTIGWKSATKYCVITSATFLFLTLPFYFYDPQGFSPLHTANELGQFHSVLPFAGIIVPLIAGGIALGLSLRYTNSDFQILFRNCAIVLAFPVLSGVFLQSIKMAHLDFSFSGFGLSFLPFGVMAFRSLLLEYTE